MSKKIIIVGGVAGGATAAARVRRLDETANILLLERGEYISFANCGLPYYIGGVIEKRDDLLVTTLEDFTKRYRIDIRNLSEAIAIDRENKQVQIKNHQTGEIYQESYDKLILSPGAEPIKPPLPGVDLPNIFTLRNIPDTDRIKDLVDAMQPKSAVVVGGGFIGLEMAENLAHRGVKTTIIEMLDQVMAPLDIEMANMAHTYLREKGVDLELGTRVEAFHQQGEGLIVSVSSGKEVHCDMVILSIGIKPENKLAKDAGLELNQRGGITVNRALQSNDRDIFVVGDAIETREFMTNQPIMVPLAGPANKQGRIAADNVSGRNSEYGGVLGTSILKLFDLTVSSTGMNEKTLKQKKLPYLKSYTHSYSHATYYPGAERMAIKLLFRPDDGKVYGAQIIGKEGVDKRIDVIATALHGGLNVYDLERLELAYAPPYSSAKDPVNVAGYVAANILKSDLKVVHWDEFNDLDRDKRVVIDLRTDSEIEESGAVSGAVNIPVDDLRSNIETLDKNKSYVMFCAIGLRGYIGYRILSQHGFKVTSFSGGYETYKYALEEH
jgi:NADPH-dependent 2,4-dienoyl-CoA reductase/sulfur reductase-like enzyme/rhodanese-related sulfurtransferase